MTTITIQPNKKWRVVDVLLKVDEEYDTCTEAHARADQCNIDKLNLMYDEENISSCCSANIINGRCSDCQDNVD